MVYRLISPVWLRKQSLAWLRMGLLTIIVVCACSAFPSLNSEGPDSSNQVPTEPTTLDFPVIGRADVPLISLDCFVSGKEGYMDTTGKLVIPLCFDNAYRFSEGAARVELRNLPGADTARRYGYINVKGEFIIPPVIEFNQFVSAYGGAEGTGYSEFSEGLLPLRREPDGKIGYINQTGAFAIEPQFVVAKTFHEGLAGVCVEEGKCGYIDTSGQMVIEPKFKNARSFQGGVAVVSLPGVDDIASTEPSELYDFYGLIDREGNYLMPPEAHKIYRLENFPGSETWLDRPDTPFSPEGLLPVRVPYSEAELAKILNPGYPDGIEGTLGYGKWGYVRRTGGYAIEPRFMVASSFYEGKADVVIAPHDTGYPEEDRGQYVQIDPNGKVLEIYKSRPESASGDRYLFKSSVRYRSLAALAPEIEIESEFAYGLAVAALKSDPAKLGYVNAQGTFVIEPQFYKAHPFTQGGMAVVELSEQESIRDVQWGLINRQGEYLIEPQDRAIEIFDNGMIGLRPDGRRLEDDQVENKSLFWVDPGSMKILPYVSYSADFAWDRMGFDSEGFVQVYQQVPDDFHF